MLARLDRGLEDGPVEAVAHVEDHDGAVVAAHGEQRRVLRVEVEAHDARLRREGVLGVAGVLEREAAHQPGALLHEVVAAVASGATVNVRTQEAIDCDIPLRKNCDMPAVAHGEEVVVLGAPAQRRHLLAPHLPRAGAVACSPRGAAPRGRRGLGWAAAGRRGRRDIPSEIPGRPTPGLLLVSVSFHGPAGRRYLTRNIRRRGQPEAPRCRARARCCELLRARAARSCFSSSPSPSPPPRPPLSLYM